MTNIFRWSERKLRLPAVSARGHEAHGHFLVAGYGPFRGKAFLWNLARELSERTRPDAPWAGLLDNRVGDFCTRVPYICVWLIQLHPRRTQNASAYNCRSFKKCLLVSFYYYPNSETRPQKHIWSFGGNTAQLVATTAAYFKLAQNSHAGKDTTKHNSLAHSQAGSQARQCLGWWYRGVNE